MAARFQITRVGAGAGARLVGRARDGWRHLAIPAGGPADSFAYRAAIDLLGLPPGAQVIELPLRGGRWRITGPCTLAFTGADFGWSLNDKVISTNTVVQIRSGSTTELRGGYARAGRYGYLAARGTILHAPNGVLAEIIPRVLQNEETLTFVSVPALLNEPPAGALHGICPSDPLVVSVHDGPESRWLSTGQRTHLARLTYLIGSDSNRQGIRLQPGEGTTGGVFDCPPMISSPVLPGTIQLTPSGPIVLGPDAQTVGGYPRVGIIYERALANLYQHRLGGRVRLLLVD